MAQEGLTNIRKHAYATSVQVILHYEADCVRLKLQDDGIGMKAAGVMADATGENRAGESPGFGLIGLRERISLLGGTIQMGNGKDGGFKLEAEVPI